MTDSPHAPTESDAQTDAHTAGRGPTEHGDAIVLLHVEPDARSAELLAAFAERSADEFAIRSVDGMRAALRALDAVDCVVTEQRLPDGSGVELVERLRDRDSEVPVVFHTTCREPETEGAAFRAGADAYFSKRSERGQYDYVLERVREAVDGGNAGYVRAATTASPDASGPPATPPGSKE